MSNLTRFVFGLIVLLILAGITIALIYLPIPEGNENALVQLVGTLSTLTGLVIGYYFGSSDGSSKKTDLLLEKQQQATGKPDDPIHVEPTLEGESNATNA